MNIAVTGLNATDNPGPGIPVIRSLKDETGLAERIVGLAYDNLEPGLYMPDLLDRFYMIPYPSSGLEALFERLRYVHSREELDLIIPTLDSELFNFEKLAPRLRELGVRTWLPSFEQLMIRGKDRLSSFCTANGIKAPQTLILNSVSDLYSVPATLPYPFVIKGIFYDAQVAHSFDEALSALHRIRTKWGMPILAQEFVAGDEFNVAALGDGEGVTVGAVAMRKKYITDKGKGWAGVTIEDEMLLGFARLVIGRTKWRGGLELEFVKNAKTQEYFLLEINPRFPAWIYLATAAGQNLPAALAALACGKTVKPFEKYEVGKLFVRCSWDLITDVGRLEHVTIEGEG